jgi:predicted O-methyltransferase YrrM
VKTTFLRKLRLLSAYPKAVATRPRAALNYLIHDREFTNLTYEIENEDELAAFVATALGRPVPEIAAFIAEPRSDERLLGSLQRALAARSDRNDEPLFGRRLAWYAVIRALQPEVVVETGVHDGLGSALLLRAVELNGSGRLIGFDVDDQSGWLVPAELRERYELVLGDVRETLPKTLEGLAVDLFIHDSLHTYEHEAFELREALKHAADGIVLVSDNAHATEALRDVCAESGLSFSLFLERPRAHFYPGAGVGLGTRSG